MSPGTDRSFGPTDEVSHEPWSHLTAQFLLKITRPALQFIRRVAETPRHCGVSRYARSGISGKSPQSLERQDQDPGSDFRAFVACDAHQRQMVRCANFEVLTFGGWGQAVGNFNIDLRLSHGLRATAHFQQNNWFVRCSGSSDLTLRWSRLAESSWPRRSRRDNSRPGKLGGTKAACQNPGTRQSPLNFKGNIQR
jgi:hypothetical protein